MEESPPVEDEVEMGGGLGSHLEAIQREWQRLQRSHVALQSENAALRLRVAELEGRSAAVAAPREGDGWVRVSPAADHAAEVIDLSLSPPPPQRQRLPVVPPVVHVVAAAPAALSTSPTAQLKDAPQSQSSGSQQSPDSSDALFNILFSQRQRKQRPHSEQQPMQNAAAHHNTRSLARAQSSAETMERKEAAKESKANEHQREHSGELLSSADRLLMELEGDDEGSTLTNHRGDEPAGDERRVDDGGAVEQRDERKEAAPAAATQAQRPSTVAMGDPFATQELGALPQLSPPLLPLVAAAGGKVVTTEEEAKAELSSVSVERRSAKECYLLHDYHEALSLYQSAEQRLSALLHANPDRPFVPPLVLPELATVLASRAAIHIKLGALDAARADVDRLRSIRAQWWKTLALEARVLVGERRLEEAISVYERAMQCDMSDEERSKMRRKKEDVERKWRHSAQRTPKDRHSPHHHIEGADSPMSFPLEPLLTIPLPPSPRAPPSTPPSTAGTRCDAEAPFDIHLSPPQAESAADHPLRPTPPAPPLPAPLPLPATQQLHLSPSKVPSQDYSLLPRITVEGVRDLLGSELFHRAESALSAVYKIKVSREEGEDGMAVQGDGGEAVLVLAKCKPLRERPRKRRRADVDAAPFQLQEEASRSAELLDVALRFRGNRVLDWSCTCSAGHAQSSKLEQKATEGRTSTSTQPAGVNGDAARPAWEDEDERDHVDASFVPCRHVGAVLLLLRNKQSVATPSSTPTAQSSLYLHPSHVLSASVLSSLPAVYERYAELKVDRLRHVLQLNGERLTGVKEELIERCVEGEVRGVLGKCARCGGSLYYANGKVHCKGVFDVVRRAREPCHLHLPEELAPRRAWRCN